MLSAGGNHSQDWSSSYRLFEEQRINQKELFAPAIRGVLGYIGSDEPLFAMMDDTLKRKRGHKVSGTGWKRDPLGPAFHTNFVWGQRYLQISAVLPDSRVAGRARGIPIGFYHAPSAAKPGKRAAPEALDEYKVQQKACKISVVGANRLAEFRKQVPDRKIVCAVDGGFTNKEVFQSIPDNTVLIGRIRKDARLFKVPEKLTGKYRGRKKYYGDPLSTPEEVRKDESIPWQTVTAFAAGRLHEFHVKTIGPVRWKSSKDRDMLIVIIRPLAYRPRKGAKLLYRDPAYLICSDTQLPLAQLLQAYLWRWEIELNFRDEKTIIGVGEAQVRTAAAVQNLPAFLVASYAFLLLAAHAANLQPTSLPSAKWYPKKPPDRCSTNTILALFRFHSWGLNFHSLDSNKSGFVSNLLENRNQFFSSHFFTSAVCFAAK